MKTEADKRMDRLMWTGICLMFSTFGVGISAMIGFWLKSPFVWFLVCLLGIWYLCLAFFAGALAYKYKSEGLGVWIFLNISFVVLCGSAAYQRDVYQLRFDGLIKEFSGLYHQAFERYTSDPSIQSHVDHDLHGKKIVWFRSDANGTSLEVLPPSTGLLRVTQRSQADLAPNIGEKLFAQRKKEADFVVVQHDLPKGTLLTVFHVSTKRIKSIRLMPWHTKTVTETVIPGPGGGVEYVDKKVGPIGMRYHHERVRSTELIKRYVQSVIVD